MKTKLIVLMGLDGSGKTTQAEHLRDWLRGEGVAAETVWMRGESYLTRPVLAVGKAILKAPKESKRGQGAQAGSDYDDYIKAKRTAFGSRAFRKLWAALAVLDLYITFRMAFWRLARDTKVVILDRYIYDTFIDIDTAFGERGSEALRMLDSTAARLFPRPDLVLLLEITPQEAMRRKNDIPSMGYLEERGPLYKRVASAVGAVRIDAGSRVEEVEDRIREVVRGALK